MVGGDGVSLDRELYFWPVTFEMGYLPPDFGLHLPGHLFLVRLVFYFSLRYANPTPNVRATKTPHDRKAVLRLR